MNAIIDFFYLGFGFYLFLLFFSIVFLTSCERDEGFALALCTFIPYSLLYLIYYKVSLHWKFVVPVILGYFVIGAGWSLWRWFRHCKTTVQALHSNMDQRLSKADAEQRIRTDYRVIPSSNKSRLTSWVLFWPWSMFWNLLGDLLTGIYDSLAGIYIKISDSVITKAIGR